MVSEAKKRRLEALTGRHNTATATETSRSNLNPDTKSRAGAQAALAVREKGDVATWPYTKLLAAAVPSPHAGLSRQPRPGNVAERVLQSALESTGKYIAGTGQAGILVQDRTIMLDTPAPVKTARRPAGRRARHKLLPKIASRKHITELKLDVLEQDQCSYVILKKLNALWTKYAEQLLASQQNMASAVLMLDMHGCECVVHSHHKAHPDVTGIVLKASTSMWHIMTENNKVVSCHRAECDIVFCVGQRKITILAISHGHA